MKHLLRKAAALIALLTVFSICSAALAEFTAKADKTSVTAGDAVTVTFTVTGKKLSVAEGSFSYDPSLLSFTEGDGGASDGFFAMYSAEKNGSSSLSARVTFTALAAGEASVSFEIDSLLNYEGKAQDKASASVAISISAAPAEPTSPPVDYKDPAFSIKAENVYGAASDMYVWRSIENVTIPSRYSEADVEYLGETVKGAMVKDSDAPTLLYLSDASGDNAGYFVYDAARSMLYPYQTVSSASKSYILLEPDDSVTAPDGFTQTTLDIGDKTVKAWSKQDAQGDVYLVYARNPGGEIGFFYYSAADESLQRYAVLPARPEIVEPEATAAPTAAPMDGHDVETPPIPAEGAEGTATSSITVDQTLFIVICGAGALFLVLFVVSIVVHSVEESRRRKRMEQRRRERAAASETSGK